jgi:hypothetical protein
MLAALCALLQAMLPQGSSQPGLSGFDLAAVLNPFFVVCSAHAGSPEDGADAPPGQAPASEHRDCLACCLAVASLGTPPNPPALAAPIAYSEPVFHFSLWATVPDLRFTSDIRSRAPPIPG